MSNTIIFIIIATIAQYILSALWYSVMFGKQWAIINGFDLKTKEEQDALTQSMGPFYGLQLLITTLFNTAFAWGYSLFKSDLITYGGLILCGFMIPIILESIIWGNTEKKHWGKQVPIMILNRALIVGIAVLVGMYYLKK